MKKTTKTIQKMGFCLLGVFFTLSTVTSCACSPNGGGGGDSSSSTVTGTGYEVWGAPATEKILQNVDDSEYAALKTDVKIDIDTAKGEYEGSQIVISAGGDVGSYTVQTSDLVLKREGEADVVYSKDLIDVYSAMYTHVVTPWQPDAVAGWYPDAILPIANAVEYGENKVKAGENQSLYITFNTPVDQVAGTYTGNIVVTVDGNAHTVPVSLRVRNVTVSEETHQVSMFINTWQFWLGEYDSTQAMLDKYAKKLYDYRVAPTSLVMDSAGELADAVYYAEKAYELAADKRVSTICIPLGKRADGIPKNQFVNYLTELAKKCFETGVDLLSKCYVYAIDEPGHNSAWEKCKNFDTTFKSQKQVALDNLRAAKSTYLEQYADLTEEYFEQILTSIEGVRHVTTNRYVAAHDDYIDIWCPTFKDYETDAALGKYDGQTELWWYGALNPKSPYPNYHLDDDMLAPRMLGWLQAIYNIKGNIYWGTNVYGEYNGSYQYRDEYYTDAGHYYAVNGDGYLFYPGKKYGVDGPLASLRLESIRDGYEEYELLYALIEKYAQVSEQIGVDFSALDTIKNMAGSLYVGTQITADTKSFAQAREQILNLSEFSESGICFTSYKDNGEGIISYEVFVPDGAELTVTGASKGAERVVAGGKIVTYTVSLQDANAPSAVVFSTQIEGQTVSVERELAGKVTVYNAEAMDGAFIAGVDTERTLLVDALAISGEEGKLYQIGLKGVTTATQDIRFANAAVLSAIGKSSSKVLFNFYFTGDETDYPIMVYLKYKKKPILETLTSASFYFNKGENVIEWNNVNQINWDKNGELEFIIFRVMSPSAQDRNDLYLKSIAAYAVKEG